MLMLMALYVLQVPREKWHRGSGEASRKASRTGSSPSEKGSSVTSDVAEKIKKRSTERHQQNEGGKDKGCGPMIHCCKSSFAQCHEWKLDVLSA